jgi:GxxExxY protein
MEDASASEMQDLFIVGRVVVELKAVKKIDGAHIAQLLNYLKAGSVGLGLLINFGGPGVEVRRYVMG